MSGYPDSPGFFENFHFFKVFGGFLFTFAIGVFLYVIVRSIRIWMNNNASEIVTKAVTIVDKRTKVWGGSGDSSANTHYYVTFEMDDRSRVELQVRGDRFGLIVIGDHGVLTYQGTRFKDFQRSMNSVSE